MSTIMDFYNTGLQARNNQIQNQYLPDKLKLANQYQGLVNSYYGPEHQAAIDYQKIINQYQPEKSRLGNEYQGLVNQYYAPDMQSQIDARNIETKFTPLKYAVQADNSVRNNSRFGGSYQYLKAVSDMPADQKTVWMANPENYQQYQAEIQNLHNSMSNKQESGNNGTTAVTPALLKSVGLGPISGDIIGNAPSKGVQMAANQPPSGGLASPQNMNQGPVPPQGAPPVVINMPQNGGGMPPQMSAQPQGGMGAPFQMPGMTMMGSPPPMGGNAPMGAPAPQGAPPMGQQQGVPPRPMPAPLIPANTPPLTPQAANVAQKNGVDPQEANNLASAVKNPALSPQDKQLLSFQMIANKKSIPAALNNQANSAIVYEKLLGENKDRIEPAFLNAAKYAGALGRGKLFAQQFQAQHPQEYQDYTWVVNDLVPALGQNIRRIEGLASTDGQRGALNKMFTSVLQWNSDPQMAINNINKTIGLFEGQARAVLEAAQPAYPGVLEKIHGIDFGRKTYLNSGAISKLSDAEIMQRLGGK